MKDAWKRLWMRFALRGVRYSDRHARLEEAYLVPDPWRLGSAREEARFLETSRLLSKAFGRPERLLEVGCGEGHQSAHLLRLCGALTGIDVSARALARARARCPGAEFLAADLFSRELDSRAPFDLVLACEVLYYMKDPAAALERLEGLGTGVLVTCFEDEWATLDPILASRKGAGSAVFGGGAARWKAWWWTHA